MQCHLDMNGRTGCPPLFAIPLSKGSLGFMPMDTRDVLSPGGWPRFRILDSIPVPEVAWLTQSSVEDLGSLAPHLHEYHPLESPSFAYPARPSIAVWFLRANLSLPSHSAPCLLPARCEIGCKLNLMGLE